MSVPLTGDGGFFTRQGTIVGEYNRVAAFYGSALDAGFLAIWLQFASSDQAAVQNLPDAVTAFRSSDQSYLSVLQADGQLAITLQVNDDTPVIPYTVPQALSVLAAQMRANSQSVNRPTLGSSVTPGGGNIGDTTVAVSTTNKYGDPSDMTFAETVTVTCTQATGGSSFAATLQAVGEALVPSYDYRWPAGSGANVSVAVTDPAVSGIVTDGAFANWSGTGNNTPTNWTIIDGDAGVTVFKNAGGGLRTGSDAARITSDGSQPTQLAQAVTLSTNTVYAVTVQAKVSASDGSGIFVMQLTDGDGNVIQDDAGNNLSYTRNMSAQVTTSYQNFTVFFATPRQLPVTVQVRYGLDTAPSSGKHLDLDLAAVVAATSLYNQGPYMAAIAGDTRTAVGDTYAVAFTNSLGSNSFVRGMDRVYSVRNMVDANGNQVYLPSSGSPTVLDSLVLH